MPREWWGTLLLCGVVLGCVLASPQRDAVYFFSVGQGDSQMIVAHGVRILIDAGKGGRILSELERVVPFWAKRIDMVIITHPEQDHIGGVFEVVRHYDVGVVVHTDHTNPMWDQLHRLLDEKEIPVIEVLQGDRITVGDYRMRVLWPPSSLETDNENDTSLVIKMTAPCATILYTGDIGIDQESIIAGRYALDADILKVAHHGSKFSSSESFLQAVTPVLSVIGVGTNSYGHPTKEVLRRLNDIQSRVWRTDEDGALGVTCHNNALRLEPLSFP